jgi:hypothetical protein
MNLIASGIKATPCICHDGVNTLAAWLSVAELDVEQRVTPETLPGISVIKKFDIMVLIWLILELSPNDE